MFLGPIKDNSLTLLRYTILVVGCDAPPAVINALVDSRLVVLESKRFQNKTLVLIFFGVGVKPQPKCHRVRIVHRHAEADCMIGLATSARGRVSGMRRKNPVGEFGFRDP